MARVALELEQSHFIVFFQWKVFLTAFRNFRQRSLSAGVYFEYCQLLVNKAASLWPSKLEMMALFANIKMAVRLYLNDGCPTRFLQFNTHSTLQTRT